MSITVSPYRIRPLELADLPQIHEIEEQSFPSAWPSSAYKRELAENKLARYIVAGRPVPVVPVANSGIASPLSRLRHRNTRPADAPAPLERIDGFLGLWCMVDEGHIVTVAVRESARRQGVGELLLLAAFDLARAVGMPVLTLEVRASNHSAQALYEKYGFERVGERRRYYTDNNEDALIMTTPSTDDPDYRARIEALRRRHQERWGKSGLKTED